MLAPEFYPVWGGVGTYIIELVRHLPNNIEIHVLTPKRIGFDNQKKTQTNINFSHYLGKEIKVHYISTANETFFYNAGFQAACLRYVPKFVKEEKIDIIHSHTAQMPDLLLMFRNLNLPIVTTVHTTIKSQRLGTKKSNRCLRELEKSEQATYFIYPILRFAEELYFRQKRFYICPSNWMKNWITNDYPSIKPIVRVIPNSVDVNDIKSGKTSLHSSSFPESVLNKRIILFVGRLLAMKGIDTLIEAIPKINRKLGPNNLLFIFAGPGDQTRYYNRIKDLKIDSCTFFTGPLSRQSTVDLMKMSELVIAPSLMENSPFTILEAMACEKPVVASAVGGIPEIIEDGFNGVLIYKNSSEYLASSIINILENPELQKIMGTNARQTIVNNFSWTANIDKYERLYADVLSSDRECR
jgi:glycosyltransferase involved in cell wall biosynthesis